MNEMTKLDLLQQAAGSEATKVEQQRAIAEVQAAAVLASQKPRQLKVCLAKIEEACRQKALAESAFFRYERGDGVVTGPTIQLAKELARCWGNITYGLTELDRNDAQGRSEMCAFAWDMEDNVRPATSFIVPHKRDLKGGRQKDLTSLRDVYENNANNGARRLREQIFAVIPGWVRDQAINICRQTLEGGDDDPLPARIENVVTRFGVLGVSPARIEAKLGPVDDLTAIDVANLGIIYRSILRSESTAEEEFPHIAGQQIADAFTQQDEGLDAEGNGNSPEVTSPSAAPEDQGTDGAEQTESAPSPVTVSAEGHPPEEQHEPEIPAGSSRRQIGGERPDLREPVSEGGDTDPEDVTAGRDRQPAPSLEIPPSMRRIAYDRRRKDPAQSFADTVRSVLDGTPVSDREAWGKLEENANGLLLLKSENPGLYEDLMDFLLGR